MLKTNQVLNKCLLIRCLKSTENKALTNNIQYLLVSTPKKADSRDADKGGPQLFKSTVMSIPNHTFVTITQQYLFKQMR